MLVVVGGDFAEELKEKFFSLVVIDGMIERLCDEFGDFGRERWEGLGIVDCEIDEFFGGVNGI